MLFSQDWFAFTSNGSNFNFTRAGEVVFPNSGTPTAQDNYGYCRVIFLYFVNPRFFPVFSDRSSIEMISDGPLRKFFHVNVKSKQLLRGQDLKEKD